MEQTKPLHKMPSTATNSGKKVELNRILKADIEKLMDYHGLTDDTRNIISKEQLIPTSLLSRLHLNYTQYSGLKGVSKPIFSNTKKKYSGLEDFKKICEILQENGIVLGAIKERELFIQVYRFMATKHVLNTIDWANFEKDAVFQLVFPQPGMINPETVLNYKEAPDDKARQKVVADYMEKTNPHDGKQQLNRASFYSEDGSLELLEGSQHKYPQCILLFDKTTQSCFAFCSYCFRHAQVRGDEDMFIQNEVHQVHEYLKQHPEITDILITGGDGGFMPYNRLKDYLDPIMNDPELLHIRTIRVASRALTFQPELVLSSRYDETLALFRTTTVGRLHDAYSIMAMAKWLNKVCDAKPKRFFLQGFKKNKEGMIDEDYQNENDVSERFVEELKDCVGDWFEDVEVRV